MWWKPVPPCHLHVTDLAISSQILLHMSQSDFLKFLLLFLPQLLKSALVSTLVQVELKMVLF